jgi:hypothetical protein
MFWVGLPYVKISQKPWEPVKLKMNEKYYKIWVWKTFYDKLNYCSLQTIVESPTRLIIEIIIQKCVSARI